MYVKNYLLKNLNIDKIYRLEIADVKSIVLYV